MVPRSSSHGCFRSLRSTPRLKKHSPSWYVTTLGCVNKQSIHVLQYRERANMTCFILTQIALGVFAPRMLDVCLLDPADGCYP